MSYYSRPAVLKREIENLDDSLRALQNYDEWLKTPSGIAFEKEVKKELYEMRCELDFHKLPADGMYVDLSITTNERETKRRHTEN